MVGGLLILSTTVSAVLLHDPAYAAGSTFTYSGGEQTYTVPAGVTSVTITAVGAPGRPWQRRFLRVFRNRSPGRRRCLGDGNGPGDAR